MKKITILLAITALVAGAASCNKIENNNADSGIKVNIAVSDLTPGTKAIKSGWSDGDIINVYLNDATSYVPDFQLTYSGGSWSASAISDAVAARLQAFGGTLQGFWEGSNSAISGSAWDTRSSNWIHYDESKDATTGKVQHLIASFADIDYTFDGTTVTASLDTWYFRSNIQIVVTGLPAGTYALYGDAYASGTISIQNFNNITMGNNTANMPSLRGLTSSSRRIAGIANEDGIAFVGAMNRTEFHTGDKIVLHLVKNAGGSETLYTCTKTLTSTDILITDGAAYGSNAKVYAANVPITAFTAE